ncbi:MAG: division/cell wall cluster transcriptional repressor MraZ [Caulobacteraceae bacterium]|nr:division/cell wall cluster transcriptional repressor MraZ [Caulobacter sp.]
MFLSTFDKELDAKRRIVVPAEFRALSGGACDGVYLFPSIEADCLEGGGEALFARYRGAIEELPFGDPLRSALETAVYSGMSRLQFDSAGRIVLPEELCAAFGIGPEVTLAGLGDRFQVWGRAAFREHRERQRLLAREGLARLREAQRLRPVGAAA